MSTAKPQLTESYEENNFQEFETRQAGSQMNGKVRMVESARLGLTLLGLLAAITIVGTSGDTLMVFNSTTLSGAFNLSLWPTDFDIRPTVALVTCGAVVVLASIMSLAVSKIPATRNHPLIHGAISLLAPTVCLIAALVGTSFFYGVNRSNTSYSLQAWTCQWSAVSINVKPHWGTLCKESKVALYLSVILIPAEVLVLASAAYGAFLEKKQPVVRERKGSPAMS